MNIQLIILTGFFVRLGIAFWNGFFGPSFGAESDAVTFHLVAVDYAKNPVFPDIQLGWIYAYILGLIYAITLDHLFIGSLLSCIFWLLSAYYLLKTLKLLDIEKEHIKYALLIYALLPSSILYTSVTLREVYQLFFINLAIFSALMIYIKQKKSHLFTLLFSLICAGFLHGSLMIFGIIFLGLFLFFYSAKDKKITSLIKVAFVLPIILLIFNFGLSFFNQNAYNLEEGLIGAVEKYQEGGLTVEGRANYKNDVDINGLFAFITFIPISLFQYLFEPMPWRISSIFTDTPIFLENLLRAFLIFKAFKNLRTPSVQYYYRILLLLITSFFMLETIWSLGTINWGTASRHHIPSIGLLLISAFAIRNHQITKN